MLATGRVVPSINNGVTSVTVPPSQIVYRAAPKGDVFVTFEVPTTALHSAGAGMAKIYAPSVIFGPKFGISEMPIFRNLLVQ